LLRPMAQEEGRNHYDMSWRTARVTSLNEDSAGEAYCYWQLERAGRASTRCAETKRAKWEKTEDASRSKRVDEINH